MIEGLQIAGAAERRFTDREEPKSVFQEALTKPQRYDEHRIRVWYGVGGQGKTALLNEFHRLITNDEERERHAASLLDFSNAGHRNPTEALVAIRRQLGGARLIFPEFDLAFERLFRTDYPHGDIRAAYPDLYANNENEIFDFLEGLGQLAYGGPILALLYKYGHRLPDHLRKWWSNDDVKKRMLDLDTCTAIELREKLPVFLGRDLAHATNQEDAPRIVLMVDTYEALWRQVGEGAMQNPRVDKWFRTLVGEAGGIFVTICSRDKLSWGESETIWNSRLEQHLLGGLSEQDAIGFLRTAGVQPEAVCRQIASGARGLPFYLDLAVTEFERIRAGRGTVTPDDFTSAPDELVHRFIDHLTEAERSELLLASYPDDVTESLLNVLADTFPGAVAGTNWQRLNMHSFITRTGHGRAILHSLMREGLQTREHRERPNHFRRVHLWLFEHFDNQVKLGESEQHIGEKHDGALLAAARHLAEVDAARLASWILDLRWTEFSYAGRYVALSKALEKACYAMVSIGDDRTASRAWEIHHHLAHVYQQMGRNKEAKELFNRARELYDNLKRKDPIVYATILHAIADVSRALGEAKPAEDLYERALNIYRDEPARYQQRFAEVLLSLASIRQAQGLRTEAQRYFQQARESFKSVAADKPTDYAEFLYRLAYAQYEYKFLEDAKLLYQQALEIYKEQLGDRDPYYADALLYVSACCGTQDQAEAEEGFRKAVSIYRDKLGEEHPKFGRGLHIEARFRMEHLESPDPRFRGPFHTEMQLSAAKTGLERATKILRDTLGNDHDWTTQALLDLASCKIRCRYGGALPESPDVQNSR